MKSYLKVKIKSLAAEAAIIRIEERRAKREHAFSAGHQDEAARCDELLAEMAGLHRHRVVDVRREQRTALLAYACLRERPYATIEAKCGRGPDARHIGQLVARFGERTPAAAERDVAAWLKGGNMRGENAPRP